MFTLSPKFVLLLMLTTLALFLFPAPRGSFTSTHGPTTALRADARFRAVISALAAWTALLAGKVVLSSSGRQNSEAEVLTASYPASQLRC
ncbi:MAG: hypothetical protein ROO76_11035 [Terriglobia bacterium]|jgi:hypothetical protein|nr:hypothetical protein [Terriglobia bacterium]